MTSLIKKCIPFLLILEIIIIIYICFYIYNLSDKKEKEIFCNEICNTLNENKTKSGIIIQGIIIQNKEQKETCKCSIKYNI